MRSNTLYLKQGRGRTRIELEAKQVGRDWCLHITGGQGHIGACAVGSVDPSSGRSFASLITLPGHKEGAWSLKLAERLARELRHNILVTVGIHLDGIKKSEMNCLEKNIEELLILFLRKRKKS